MDSLPPISMPVQFSVALIFILASLAFVAFNLLFPRLLRPTNPYPDKLSTYECGERPIGGPWVRFNIRFYIVAIIFLIFDVEVLFLVPWAVVYKSLLPQLGGWVFVEMFVFILILGVALAYCWNQGHLEWILRERSPEGNTDSPSR